MSVCSRTIQATYFRNVPVLGAVATPKGVLAAFAHGVVLGADDDLETVQTGRGTLAYVPSGMIEHVALAELDHFENLKVIVALRNGETPQAAADWVRYHHTHFGATGALIFNRAPPGSDGFIEALQALLDQDAMKIIVVDADTSLGRKDAPDARNAALAPAFQGEKADMAENRWHSALAEQTIYEILRHRFLASAGGVAFLAIADHLLPAEISAFDLAKQNPGHAVPLVGTEVYPWRLRQGQPAAFADHIAKRRGERRRLLSWCCDPRTLQQSCVWQSGRPIDTPVASKQAAFARAIGIVFPGVAVEKIVKKSDLTEDAPLVSMFENQGLKPIRLPDAAKIPARPANGSVTIVSVMKNEGPFILDWIAHNRAIGVERFLIYTNDCEDGTDRLLECLGDAGVTHRVNPYRDTGNVPQYAAFSAAEREEVVTSSDWLLTLDVDEYINIHTGDGRLADLFDAVPEAHVISMPWRLFGNADEHAFKDKPVTEQFTKAAPEFMPRPYQAWAFKSLYRNAGLFKRLGVHRPKGVQGRTHDAISWVNGSGKTLPPEVWRSSWRVGTANWGYDLVTLNHYAVRSADSFW